MALYGFSDILFNKNPSNFNKGPLAGLQGDSIFKSRSYRYPLDIGNADKGHYMVIYIRQQNNSAFSSKTVSDDSINERGGSTNVVKNILQGIPSVSFANEFVQKFNGGVNKINETTNGVLSGLTSTISRGLGDAARGLESGINNVFGQASKSLTGDSASTQTIISGSIKSITDKRFGALRRTTLTTDAIALYMPDTLNYQHHQRYSDMSPGNSLLGQMIEAGVSSVDGIKAGGDKREEAIKNAVIKAGLAMGKQLAKDKAGEFGALGAFAATGVVTNPMLELLYTSPSLRTLHFDFFFYPRDEREALEVQKIIERLKFHQAPEISGSFGKGFLIPPSEFDIKFYYNGAQNPNIPQVSTCILEDININYAPNGFSAYEVPNENIPSLGRTGMPVSIQLTLQFKEVTYLTKQDFNEDLIGASARSGSINGSPFGNREGR